MSVLSEKTASLPTSSLASPTKPAKRFPVAKLAALLALVPASLYVCASHSGLSRSSFAAAPEVCVQPPALAPQNKLYPALEETWKSQAFLERSISWLSKAVQVETESFDGMDDVGDDPRWEKFANFHAYLLKAFPLVHKHLSVKKVNTWALVYEWKGSDESLLPLLLTGHQDVVPVSPTTVSQWNHPPYSGHYDGEYIWGRGSVDDKSGLIGIMSALESLLEGGFSPKRSIVIASGMDEEAGGRHGAGPLYKELAATYGTYQDGRGFSLLVDEGGGYADVFGMTVAALGTGEKGYGNVRVRVETLGGHSSIPPDHTSIGYLSLLIAQLESHPHSPLLTRENPFYSLLQCAAEHGTSVPLPLKTALKLSSKSDKALEAVGAILGSQREYRGFVSTTQAVDLISGGVKVNALPEKAEAVVNHRINVASSADELRARFIDIVTPTIKELNLTLAAFGKTLIDGKGGSGHVVLEEAFDEWLNPSPITPTTPETVGWNVLAGSVKHTFNSRSGASANETEIIASPAIMTGNTDTKYWWPLTRQIYRYGHLNSADFYVESGIHSVNEALRATAFVDEIRFFGTLILNSDEAVY